MQALLAQPGRDMPVTGPVDSVRVLGAQDNFCCVHSSPGAYRADLAGFFAHGVARGLGLWVMRQLGLDTALIHHSDGFTVRLRTGTTAG